MYISSVQFSHSVVSDSSQPHGLQPTRLLCHGIFQARVLERGAMAFSEGRLAPTQSSSTSSASITGFAQPLQALPAVYPESNKGEGDSY